ncbi:MAG TPA: FAD-dependent oxidoreductase [Bordetella sp.]|nr:FAD-dependent oxidoreductase [Bordetella sp.]
MNDSGNDADIVVVGSGIAGLSATVTALQHGLRVIVLERAPREEYGGNSRWTEAYLRMKNESEVSDDFETMFAENAGCNLDPNVLAAVSGPYRDWPPNVKAHGLPDPELISTFSASAGPTLAWLKEFGIRFDRLPMYLLTVSAPRIMPVGGGLALIEALSAHAHANGAIFLYEHTAQDLLVDEDGRIAGVAGRNAHGLRFTARGKGVVLASGGFEGNPEMLAGYIGRGAEFIRPVAPGGYYNKGEGIRMALARGAAPAGDYGSYHAEPVDPRSRQPEAIVMNYPYGILVNAEGRRFVDEAPGPADNHYDPITKTIAHQPRGIAHVVFDQRINDVPNWRRSIRSDQPVLQADTLEALARLIDVPPETLQATVAGYNAACREGQFKAAEVDGLSTQGLVPRKSNWARPIDMPPYSAYPIISANCFTYGGLKVNSSAQVLDMDGRIIAGLYAAGETLGIYYQTYTGATSVLRGAVFGRIAATTHARYVASAR